MISFWGNGHNVLAHSLHLEKPQKSLDLEFLWNGSLRNSHRKRGLSVPIHSGGGPGRAVLLPGLGDPAQRTVVAAPSWLRQDPHQPVRASALLQGDRGPLRVRPDRQRRRGRHCLDPWTPACCLEAYPPWLCSGPNNSWVWPVRAGKPGSDFQSALSRVVHEARNHLRLVACSVAAYSTEAQKVQEGLSKVRELQGGGGSGGVRGGPAQPTWCPGGIQAVPLPLGGAALDQAQECWDGWEVRPQRRPEVGMEKAEGTS